MKTLQSAIMQRHTKKRYYQKTHSGWHALFMAEILPSTAVFRQDAKSNRALYQVVPSNKANDCGALRNPTTSSLCIPLVSSFLRQPQPPLPCDGAQLLVVERSSAQKRQRLKPTPSTPRGITKAGPKRQNASSTSPEYNFQSPPCPCPLWPVPVPRPPRGGQPHCRAVCMH